MTEPDEALMWAREKTKARLSNPNSLDLRTRHLAEAYRAGYRHGQAASAYAMKVLEEDVKAARLEGIRLGLEAAAKEAVDWAVMPANFYDAIRLLDPETIAKEADQ
jgi:hypothetical protein